MSDETDGPTPGTEFNPQSGFPVPGTGDEQPPPTPPPPPYGQPYQQYPQNPYVPGQPWPSNPPYPAYQSPAPAELPQANTAFILGLISVAGGFMCGLPLLASPFAWITGARARRAIRESHGQLGGEGRATAGFVLGIIGTAFLVLGLIALAIIIVVAINADPSSGYDDGNYTSL